jgi:hypothetical protein
MSNIMNYATSKLLEVRKLGCAVSKGTDCVGFGGGTMVVNRQPHTLE